MSSLGAITRVLNVLGCRCATTGDGPVVITDRGRVSYELLWAELYAETVGDKTNWVSRLHIEE